MSQQEAPPSNDATPPSGSSFSAGSTGSTGSVAAVSATAEPTLDERARSIVTDFDLAPEIWDRMRSEPQDDLAREIASMRGELAQLRGESEAIHAGADRAVAEGDPQANAGVAGKLQPILRARRKVAAEMMIASLAKQARAAEAP